jgi:hypothetical protein
VRLVVMIALVGCADRPISEVPGPSDVPQKLVTTSFTGGSACLDGPLVTPVFCTVFDGAYLVECDGTGEPCWDAIEDAECASRFQIVVVSELPVATSAMYEATCWSR